VDDAGIGGQVWRLLEPADLTWRCWDDEYVVFHPFSGMTHYLDATAGGVFEVLLTRPATVDDLTVALADLGQTPVTESLGVAVQQILRRFDEVGLAETQS